MLDIEFGTPFSFRLIFVEKTEKYTCAGLTLKNIIYDIRDFILWSDEWRIIKVEDLNRAGWHLVSTIYL